eukprot:scaffold8530_cov154-Skeletonema_dohrnii-CCMP3373.AAC.4
MMNITSTPSLETHFSSFLPPTSIIIPLHTQKYIQIQTKTHLVLKGATDGTKADEEAKTVARRMAVNFMVVIYL